MDTYYLTQQTPMIHFQHYEQGACLRASEVKPKLDRFIIKQMGGDKKIDPSWWISPKTDDGGNVIQPALNYKLRFEAIGNPAYSTDIHRSLKEIKKNANPRLAAYIDEKMKENAEEKSPIYGRIHIPKNGEGDVRICASYLGNMVAEKGLDRVNKIIERYKETVFYTGGVKMCIICYCDKLREEIKESLPLFFLTHNFGTRQDKGFGSFLFKKSENGLGYSPEKELEAYLHENGKNAYYFDVNKNSNLKYRPSEKKPCIWALDAIPKFYGELKSGLNNGYEYKPSYLMKRYGPFKNKLNDKRAMKQALVNTDKFSLFTSDSSGNKKGIAYYDDNGQKTPLKQGGATKPAVYVRGLLGYAQEYTFQRVKSKTTRACYDIKFSVDGGDVERFASPILFKPILINPSKARVYLIPDRDAFERLFKRPFAEPTNRSITLTCKAEPHKGGNKRESDEPLDLDKEEAEALSKIKLPLTVEYHHDFLDNFLDQAYQYYHGKYIGGQKLERTGVSG